MQQATDDIIQGKRDIQAVRKEAEGIWAEVKQAVSELGGGGDRTTGGGANAVQQGESSAGLAWEGLRRDAKRAVHGMFSDVSEPVVPGSFRVGCCDGSNGGDPPLLS